MAMGIYGFLKTRDGERSRPPEKPLIYTRDIPSDARLTFVDFVPSVSHRGQNDKIFYHPFSNLLEVANKWLQHNFDWEVITCECVTLLFRHNSCTHVSQWDLLPNIASAQVMGQESAIKAFRIWIKRREEIQHIKKKVDIQLLGYRDFVPEKRDGEKIESLDEVMSKINTMIKDGEFEGNIISVQCLHVESTGDFRFDPEATLPSSSDKTVTIVRIFYESGPPPEVEIGIADFIPVHISGGSLFSRPEFETFDNAISRAFQWLSENPEINFLNAQTIDFKLKSMTNIDTKIMTQTEQPGDFIRILRIAYAKPFDVPEDIDQSACLPPPAPVFITSKMFLLKSYADFKKVISDWYNTEIVGKDNIESSGSTPVAESSASKSKYQLMSCETLSILAKNDRGLEESLNSNRIGSRNRCTFIAVRLYHDIGFYAHKAKNEAEVLISPKADKDSQSCDIM